MTTQHEVNQQQYQDKSEAYLNSIVHAQGIEFEKIREVLQQQSFKRVLDLGCGGGHVTYHIAPDVEQVIAYDLTAEMVNLVLQQASQRNLNNVIGQQGPAEKLPFDDQSICCVVSRYSAHHWQNVPQAMSEIFRVLKPKGSVIFIDILGNQQPVLDTFLQSIEIIRDPSHVRDYSLAEWMTFAERAGFKIDQIEKQNLKLNFQSWVERMQTPAEAVATLRYLQQKASDVVKNYYQIQPDGSFQSEVMYLVLTKPE
ncbi:class I SAM-dependent methyltransferase [Acinetobacter guerrae]|uniref:Class I SAM-dependent methyltransferase n=1 Tax=Acinetobacter guerrae TaxID=1843371 RepID=A0A3A8EMP7_9GAMM|nr:class I SAM-dependent methyltransferase [Acinetobacter guerrae]RKG36177.1 class I SAM-dependent methyltransferase [Acinetobacter guerrae]